LRFVETTGAKVGQMIDAINKARSDVQIRLAAKSKRYV